MMSVEGNMVGPWINICSIVYILGGVKKYFCRNITCLPKYCQDIFGEFGEWVGLLPGKEILIYIRVFGLVMGCV